MRHSGYYIILLLLTALSVSSYADNRQARKLIRKGNALYRADKRQEAQVDYLKAYRADSTDARVQYNLATSMFPQDYKLVQKELPDIKHFHFHALRHTYASTLVTNGANFKDVQELMGHSDIRITLNTYSHVTQHSRKKAVAILEDALAR